ncbi:MAG: AAA family ATPase [Actinomycetota bacterium]
MSKSEAPPQPPPSPDEIKSKLERALFEMKRVIVGQDPMLERVFVSLLSGGHLLLEGVPGLAKTLTIRTLAQVLGGSFARIQFTPDLVPSDLVGTRIYNPHSTQFDVELGPVFCNFLLADEINRAPAKVQSALLEVMQEQQVTIGHHTYQVESPFLVMATQNPIESEGTYPLPEAQVDRFMMKVVVGYPAFGEEMEVVHRSLDDPVVVNEVITTEEVLAFQRVAESIYVDRPISEYAVALTLATREPGRFGRQDLHQYINYGASPRGSINLVHGAQALALMRGRRYVLPQDVREIAKDVLRHRMVLSYDALAEEVTPDRILDDLVAAVPSPHIELANQQTA